MPAAKPGSKDKSSVQESSEQRHSRMEKRRSRKHPIRKSLISNPISLYEVSPTIVTGEAREKTLDASNPAVGAQLSPARRSRSQGRNFLASLANRVSTHRSRSKSKSKKENPPEISAPILISGPITLTSQPTFRDSYPSTFSAASVNNDAPGAPISIPFTLPSMQSKEISNERNRQSFIESPDVHRVDSKRLKFKPLHAAAEQCSVCRELVDFVDRYEMVDRVYHRPCFRCWTCGEPLSNRSAICKEGVWYCAQHFAYNIDAIDSVENRVV